MTNNRNANANANVIPIPVGYRFRPTDEELLLHYLKPKLHSLPLPASVIPTHSLLFHSHPSHLPGELKEKRYFFCKRKMSFYHYGNKSRMTSVGDGSGYWKAIGKDKTINVSTAVIGTKKSLVFYQTTLHHALKTHWLMLEYSLLHPPITFTSTQEMEDWVICCIYQRKGAGKSKPICDGVMDFMSLGGCDKFGPPPMLYPSCSSDNDELVD